MKFAVDNMLAGLLRWLRLLGFNSIRLDSMDDQEPKDEKYSGRIFLTTSPRHHHSWKGDHKIIIPSDKIPDQLDYLNEKLSIYSQTQFLSRCSICNEEILPVEKTQVAGEIPDKVFDSFENFYQCSSCKRIYWKGGHVERMIRKLRRMGIQIKLRRCDE